MSADENPLLAGTSMEKTVKAFHGLLFGDEAKEVPETPEAEAQVEATPEAPKAEEPEAADTPEAPEATEEAPTKRSRKLKFGDEEIEVDEDEAYNGYLRQKDYTRKTQLTAEQRKKAEAEAEAARKSRDEYAGQLETLSQVMDSWVPKEPNWGELAHKLTPEEYTKAHAEYQTFQKNRQAVEAERKRVADEQQADWKKRTEERLASEGEKLLTALPEWQDESVRTKEQAELRGWLKGKGLTEDEVNSIYDHRAVVAWRNAMRYETLQQQKPEVKEIKPKTKTAIPGSSSPAKPATDRQRDLARLKKSGKMDDAARAFSHFVD
jgi:hypothetical protein